MRTLIFGGRGMLGRALVVEARRRKWPVLGLSRAQADITQPEVPEFWMESFRPEVVINCSAFTRVDDCEQERQRAFEVNGESVARIVAAAQAAGARLVQPSTDYVFDGRAKRPYREEARTAPLSVYGQSKLKGEEAAKDYPDALVVRTSWLFGPWGPNFVANFLNLLAQGTSPLRVVDDQVGCPTYAPYLARALLDLVVVGSTGVLHYCNREAVSWFEFASEIAALCGSSAQVTAVTSEEFPRPAPRPRYSVLDTCRSEAVLGRRVEPWICGLFEYLNVYRGKV